MRLIQRQSTLIGIICAASAAIWVYLLTSKFLRFGYYDWDLAFYTQGVSQLSRLQMNVPLVGVNFFGDHAVWMAWILVPLFKIFPSPLTLLYFKIFAFHLAAVSVYIISRRLLDKKSALLLLINFLILPANIFAMLYEFNFDCLATLGLLWMTYFYMEKRFKPFLLWGVFCLLIKENMALIWIMFGIMSLFSPGRDKRVWAGIPILIGGIYFYLMVFLVIPSFRGLETHAFVARYRHLGNTLPEIIKNILIHPFATLRMLFDPRNLRFLFSLGSFFLLLGLLKPSVFFLCTPLLLQHLLSNHPSEHEIYFHYAHALIPFFIMAGIYFLKDTKWLNFKKFAPPAGRFALLVFLTALNVLFSFTWLAEYRYRLNLQPWQTSLENHDLLKRIPQDKPVVATFSYLAPLSARPGLYSFHKAYDQAYQVPDATGSNTLYTKEPFRLPADVAYALIDFDDLWLQRAFRKDKDSVKKSLAKFFNDNVWIVKDKKGNRYLFKRLSKSSSGAPASRRSDMKIRIDSEALSITIGQKSIKK